MPRQKRLPAALAALVVVWLVSHVAAANQAPVARMSAYRPDGASGYAVVFDASASTDSDGQVVKFQWVFGDGTTGSGSPVTHTYSQGGSVAVMLFVWDNGGASASLTQTIDPASLSSQPTQATGNSATASTTGAQVAVGAAVGLRAPEIALPTLSGGMTYLSAYLGQPVIVEFWLSTCPGCVASTPQLEVYRSAYAAQGLVVMLVVLDRNPAAALTYLVRDNHYTNFVLAWESDGRKPTKTAYAVPGTPYTFLIDRTGVIQFAGRPDELTVDILTRWI